MELCFLDVELARNAIDRSRKTNIKIAVAIRKAREVNSNNCYFLLISRTTRTLEKTPSLAEDDDIPLVDYDFVSTFRFRLVS
jgi:hypothetical protein